ncbi:tetratricopeptide repeat protein [Actinoplanes sp. NPDC000266]
MVDGEREPARVRIEASGPGAVAADLIAGPVLTGDYARAVTLAPGVLQAPGEVDVPAGGMSNLPRPPTRAFVGRDDHLRRLTELLSASTRPGRSVVGQAVQGMGGIGKSELALQYAATRRGPGLLVWWVTADTYDHLSAGLAALAYRLQPAATTAGWSTDEAAEWATAWLQAHSGWLLVLDNADDPADIEQLLGQVDTGDVLITTRCNVGWHRLGLTPLHLGLLERDASITLLRTIVMDDLFDLDRADQLAAELGDLPLALQQAGAYIAQQHVPIGKYLTRLRANMPKLLSKVAPGHAADRAVARTWDLTLAALIREAPTALDILHALAWLAPDNLPRHVLTPLSDEDDEIDDAVAVLASYSLVTLTSTHVSVHRLLQVTLRAGATPTSPGAGHGDEDASKALTTPFLAGQDVALWWLLEAAPRTDPDEDVESWAAWRALLPHIEQLLSYLPDTAEMADYGVDALLSRTASYLHEQGRYADAVAMYRRDVAITGAANGPDRHQLLGPINNLGESLRQLGDPAAALPLFERAVAIGEAAYGPDHPQLLGPINNLGESLRQLGDPAAALPLLERALAIGEAAYGPGHPQLLGPINNLANALHQLGDPAAALPLLERALAIGEAAYGPDHPQLFVSINNLANALHELGDPGAARPLFERAVAIGEAAYGPDYPQLLHPINNLASALHQLGDPAAARPLLERAVAIGEVAYGPDHPHLLLPINNLGENLRQLGDPAAARPLFERAVAIGEVAYGPDHPHLLLPINNLGENVRQLGDPAAARPLLERAVAIGEAAYGPDHPQLLPPINNLANALHELGDPAAARPLFERAVAIGEVAYGPDHPQLLHPITNLANALHQLGDPAAARPLFERAVAIGEVAYGPDHPQLLLPINNLGENLRQLGDPAAARPLFERAVAIGEAAYGPDHPQLLHPINNLANALHQLGDPAAARPLFERAVAIVEATDGPDHARVAVRMYRLAQAIRDVDTTAAIAALERAVAIDEAAYGPHHSEVLTDLSALAGLCRDAGDHQAAVRHRQRILDSHERIHGADAYALTGALRELADAQALLGDHAAALTTRERLVHLHDQYGSEQPDVVTDLRDYARSLEILGRLHEATSAHVLATTIELSIHRAQAVLGVDE